MNQNWNRQDLAEALALRDGVLLQRIGSTVGPEDDANNWRRYLGEADDVLSHLSLCAATNPPPTDNLEAGAGDLVERLRENDEMLRDGLQFPGLNEAWHNVVMKQAAKDSLEAAAALSVKPSGEEG